MIIDDKTKAFLTEQIRNSNALYRDAKEHGDRKGAWHANGMLEMAKKIEAHLTK